MKVKSFFKATIILLCATLLSTTLIVNAKTYNVPKYDNDVINPGSGSGLSAPITKFDVFSDVEGDEKNYAISKIINIKKDEIKTFVLDYYTINWYSNYPSQLLSFEVDDNDIIDINYYRNGVSSGASSIEASSKKILDDNLPDRLIGSKINADFPKLTFSVSGLKEGITCLNIKVKSEHQYGIEKTTEEAIRILVNVSNEPLIEVPNYINLYIGSGIHSGTQTIKYDDSQRIGILNDIVNSISINEPSEVSNYNDTSTVKVLHRILTDDKILVQNDNLSFIDTSSEANFTIEYYVVTSTNDEIEIASYSFDLIFYNLDDFKIEYSDNSFYETNKYKVGTKIKIETNERLEPYLSDIIVAYTEAPDVTIFPYEGDYVYVINKVTESTSIIIGDKLMALSGLSNYAPSCKFTSLYLTSDNVVDREAPHEIELNDNYVFEIVETLDETIEIGNINSFDESTVFDIVSDGIVNVEFTEKRQIRIIYENKETLHTTVRTVLTIEAKLDNGITLTKTINISLIPEKGYIYTFNTPSITILEGETKTVILGYLDPDFIEVSPDTFISSYYLKNGNAIIMTNEYSTIKFDIVGYKAGTDTAYFIVNEQIVELKIIVKDKNSNKIEQFNFNEGSNLSILASASKTYLTIPEKYSDLEFKFIVFDNEILTIDTITSNRITIKGLKDGTTQVFAYAQKDNVFYNAVISIKIITTIPKVNIIYEKDDTTKSLTKYDDIKITFDASNFDFSTNTIYKWYLNDELIYDGVKEFKRKFDEGLNTLKLVITDVDNNLNLEATQQLMITSVENVEKTLSINTDKIIYVDLHQGTFEISALLDGVLDPNYKYLWSISNSSICKISLNGNEKVIIEPLYIGEVDLTVMTNISKYEEVFIKSEIKIVVLEPTYKIIGNSFIKPNSDQTFEFLGDGKTIYNLKPILDIKFDGQEFDEYVFSNKNIKINNIKKGRYSVNANINGETIGLNFEATNFNFKEVVKLILPYLFIVCILVIAVSVTLKKRMNKLDRTNQKIDHLDKTINKVLKDNMITKKEVKRILSESIKVKKMLTYCIDEGIDELSIVIPTIDQTIKILTAAINTDVKDEVLLVIVKNIKNKNINKLQKEFTIIKNERNEFEQKKKVEDEIVFIKPLKEKISKNQYQEYLNSSKYTEENDEED